MLDISGNGMSTPHISHLASANPFSILSPSPQPTSSQSSTMDFHTIGGLTNGNMQFPPNVNFDEVSGISSGIIPSRKDNHKGTCEVCTRLHRHMQDLSKIKENYKVIKLF